MLPAHSFNGMGYADNYVHERSTSQLYLAEHLTSFNPKLTAGIEVTIFYCIQRSSSDWRLPETFRTRRGSISTPLTHAWAIAYI